MDFTLTDDQQKQVVSDLLSYRDFYETEAKDFLDTIDIYWSRHFGTYSCKKNKDYPWKGSADVQTGVIQYFDSSIEARFNAALNSLKFVHITAPSKAGRIAAQKCADFINDYWKPKAKPEDVCIDWFQNNVVEGVAFLKIKPVAENPNKRKRYKLVELVFKISGVVKKLLGYATDENKQMLLEETSVQDYIGCLWSAVDIAQCGFDLSVNRLKEGKFFYQEIWLTKSDCKKREKEKGWQNIDQIWLKENTNKGAQIDDVLIENQKEDTKKDYSGVENTKLNKQKFIEFWIEYDVNNDDIDEHCYFIIHPDKKILNYWSYNKFSDRRKPYIETQFYRIAGQIPGQGNPQRLGSLTDELDTLQNQKVDNSTIHNVIGGTYIPDKVITEKVMDNFVVPGKWIPVTSHKQIDRWIERGSPLDLQTQQNFVYSLLERKSNVSDYSMGRESSVNPNPTAKGTAMLLREFSINIDPLVRNLQIALQEAIRQTLLCFYETMPATGVKYSRNVPVNPNTNSDAPQESEEIIFKREYLEFLDEFTISVLAGASDIMADSEKQIATAILQMLGADVTGEIDTFAIKKNWLEKIDPVLAKDVIRTPQEVQLVQQIKQKAVELLQKEEMLNKEMMEVQKMRQDLIMKEGQKSEKEFETQLREMKLPEEKIQQMLLEYRSKFIKSKMGGTNEPDRPIETGGGVVS